MHSLAIKLAYCTIREKAFLIVWTILVVSVMNYILSPLEDLMMKV